MLNRESLIILCTAITSMTCSVMRDRYVIGAIAVSDKIQYHWFFFQIHNIT